MNPHFPHKHRLSLFRSCCVLGSKKSTIHAFAHISHHSCNFPHTMQCSLLRLSMLLCFVLFACTDAIPSANERRWKEVEDEIVLRSPKGEGQIRLCGPLGAAYGVKPVDWEHLSLNIEDLVDRFGTEPCVDEEGRLYTVSLVGSVDEVAGELLEVVRFEGEDLETRRAVFDAYAAAAGSVEVVVERRASCPSSLEDNSSVLGRVVWRFGMFGDRVMKLAYFSNELLLYHCIRATGTWEQESTVLHQALLREGDLVVDVGAHVGTKTLPYADSVGPRGKVLAFEPQPGIAMLLRANLRANGLSQRVRVLEHPIVAPSGPPNVTFLMHLYGANSNFNFMATSFRNVGRNGHVELRVDDMDEVCDLHFHVDAVVLDDVLASEPCPSFVKVDAEYMERDVLLSMQQTLLRCRPSVEMEAHLVPGIGTFDALTQLQSMHYTLFTASYMFKQGEMPFMSDQATLSVMRSNSSQDTSNVLAIATECVLLLPSCPPHLRKRMDTFFGPNPILKLHPFPLKEAAKGAIVRPHPITKHHIGLLEAKVLNAPFNSSIALRY